MSQDTKTQRANLKALQQLSRSRGWAVLLEVMQREVFETMRKLAQPGPMPPEDVHYHRGLIHGAIQLQALPENLIQRLESDLAYAEALAAHDPQTGDKK